MEREKRCYAKMCATHFMDVAKQLIALIAPTLLSDDPEVFLLNMEA